MQIVLGPSFFWENLGYKLLQAKIQFLKHRFQWVCKQNLASRINQGGLQNGGYFDSLD